MFCVIPKLDLCFFFIIFKVIVIETLTHHFLVSFTGGTLQQSRGFGSDFKFSEAVKAPHGSNIFVSSANGIEDADLYDASSWES